MFENDELETPQNSLNSELERSEGEGTWNHQDETDQETTDFEAGVDVDTEETSTEEESQSDIDDADQEETNQGEVEDQTEDVDSDEEQKNTQPEGIRRVLSYSEFLSSN